ncbi:hypothetical protein [Helicobacter zhangjianzhongii]|uniref:Uncharacterized protein n=2 Tax=Helicobacter TaxID=209 RepID=A0A377JN85_9HELI|nr:hypothetical protein [Helicobacter sp. CPD2-1]MDL0080971.1 hypothetical protein [Helicobacter sp. CPD2-1]MDL0082966.1 hypothetical protein [Helicobacter sp. XJK30-2]STP06468.1 Uncharacterised protein [Helicobacter canis]
MKSLCIAICIGLLCIGCSNKRAKIPPKSPCACYDLIIDMEKRG